jgi:DNA-binding SARP family transcriptional activator/tetratricopeptide (TPR) repeat protein
MRHLGAIMEFRVLGPLGVWVEGREIVIAAGRHRTLLAALLLRANRVVAMEWLVRVVWGEELPGDARAAVQTYVRRLRRVLGDEVIRTQPPGYVVAATVDELDLAWFDHLLAMARQVSDPRSEAGLLAQALALWEGPPLSNVESELLHREEVPALVERRLRALERRIELDLAADQHTELVAELHGLVEAHPLRERFRALLMRSLAGAGRQAEALQTYEQLRGQLADELGIDPSEQLRALHRAILRGELPVPAHPQPPPALIGQGSVVPGQLPPDVAGFTGRTTVLQRLDAMAQAIDSTAALRIVTLDGPPGVGKTALAVHWAHRARDQFPDGQLYANLRGYDPAPPVQPIQALAGFLTTLGVPADRVPTDLDSAVAMFRTMLVGRRVLLVLDNAASAGQVRPLLPGEGQCLVLVTSRNRLGGLVARDGASPLGLEVLTRAEATALLATVLGADRMARERDAATALADLCGRLPLALRIAAAILLRQPPLPIASYVERLQANDRLERLAVTGDDQSAVAAAFDLSYDRLPAAAQRMFRLLGLAPGPDIDVTAAAALVGLNGDRAESLLSMLADAHLVEQPSPGRYVLHDLLRHYAAARADATLDGELAKRRLYTHYLHAADAAARRLHPNLLRLLPLPAPAPAAGPASPAEALAWLDAERANLVAVVTETAAHGPRVVACQLADALRGYLSLNAHNVDCHTVAAAAMTAAEATQNLAAQVSIHMTLYGLHANQSHYQTAIEHADQALRLAQQAGLGDAQAGIRLNLGFHYVNQGNPKAAVQHLTAALDWYDHTGQPAGQANVLIDLALAYLLMGQVQAAADRLQRGLTRSDTLPSRLTAALAFTAQAQIHQARGQRADARDQFARARAEYSAIGLEVGVGESLCRMARLELKDGQTAASYSLAQQAMEIAQRTGHPRLETYALNTVGAVQHARGQLQESLDNHQRALKLAEAIDSPLSQTEALLGLASNHHHRGEPEPARILLRQALTIAHAAGLQPIEDHAQTALAAATADQSSGRPDQPASQAG